MDSLKINTFIQRWQFAVQILRQNASKANFVCVIYNNYFQLLFCFLPKFPLKTSYLIVKTFFGAEINNSQRKQEKETAS